MQTQDTFTLKRIQCNITRVSIRLLSHFNKHADQLPWYKPRPFPIKARGFKSTAIIIQNRHKDTGNPRYMRSPSMRVSVNKVTRIYIIPLYLPPKISISASDYETKL
jgi:hypothetical protein